MSDRGKTTSQLPVWSNVVSGNDSLILVTRSQPVPNTYIVNLSVTFANANFSIYLANTQTLSVNTIYIRDTTTPANSTAIVVQQGKVWSDGNYLYVASSNNHVKRSALSDF